MILKKNCNEFHTTKQLNKNKIRRERYKNQKQTT